MTTNVLFLEHCTDNTVGGSHYCLLEICRQLKGSAYSCTVAFYQENDLLDEFRDAGANVVFMSPPGSWIRSRGRRRNIFVRALHGLGLRFEMIVIRPLFWRKIIRRYGIDILHLNNSFSDDKDFVLAARRMGKPVIAHVRGLQTYLAPAEIRVGNKLGAIIAISDAVKQRIEDLGVVNNNVNLIYDGISPGRMKQQASNTDIRAIHEIPESSLIIGSVGNVKEWKGQRVLVEAFSEIASEFADVHCLIVGAIADDDYYQSIVEFAEQQGIQDRVTFAGYQKKVGDYLRSFDIFVHCSVEPEPFGIVILEAMSLQIPVIATSIGAPREIVEDKVSGLLFDPSDKANLVVAIRSYLSNRERMAEAGRKGEARFLEHFTSELNASRITRLYDQVLAQR